MNTAATIEWRGSDRGGVGGGSGVSGVSGVGGVSGGEKKARQ